jgi:hypothetical protein
LTGADPSKANFNAGPSSVPSRVRAYAGQTRWHVAADPNPSDGVVYNRVRLAGDRKFESFSLQRRVYCEPDSLDQVGGPGARGSCGHPNGACRAWPRRSGSRAAAAAGWRNEPAGASGRSGPRDRVPYSARRSCNRSCAKCERATDLAHCLVAQLMSPAGAGRNMLVRKSASAAAQWTIWVMSSAARLRQL